MSKTIHIGVELHKPATKQLDETPLVAFTATVEGRRRLVMVDREPRYFKDLNLYVTTILRDIANSTVLADRLARKRISSLKPVDAAVSINPVLIVYEPGHTFPVYGLTTENRFFAALGATLIVSTTEGLIAGIPSQETAKTLATLTRHAQTAYRNPDLWNTVEASARVPVSLETVRSYLEARRPGPRYKLPPSRVEELLRLHMMGVPVTKIARQLGISRATVYRYLKRHKPTTRRR